MYFAKAAIVAISAFAATVAAQATLQFTTFPPSTVQAGKSYSITYMGDASKPATILLRRGPSGNLQTVATLTTKALAGAYEFTPSSSLANGNDYALEIEQGDQSNYTPQFAITGGMGGSSSSAMSSTASSTASSTGSSTSQTSMVTMPYPAGNGSSVGPTGTAVSSGMPTPSSGSNSTFTSASISPSTPAQTSAPAAATTTAAASAAAGRLGSPLALIAGIVAGLAYLN